MALLLRYGITFQKRGIRFIHSHRELEIGYVLPRVRHKECTCEVFRNVCQGIGGVTCLKTTGVGDLILATRLSVNMSRIPSACQRAIHYDVDSVPKSCPNEMRNAVDRDRHTVPRSAPALANPSCSSNDMTKRQLSVL